MSIETDNELIEDLRDQIHDLEQDLKDLQRENDRYEKEIQEYVDDLSQIEEKNDKLLAAYKAGDQSRMRDIEKLKSQLNEVDLKYEELQHNFIKALSIAETVKMNGNTEYFKTDEGRILLDWGVSELKNAAATILKG